MIDLDPAIVDQETLRKKRRKKYLLIALGPCIVLTVISLFFLRPACADVLYRINFDGQNGGGAVTVARMQQFSNLIEPYVAYYNAGTALIQQNNGKEAEKEFRQSLANNPPEDKICQVRVNLSYSIELQADYEQSQNNNDEALVLFSKAEGVLYENGCASKDNSKTPPKDSHAEEAKKRIGSKRNQVISAIDSNYGSGDSGSSSPEQNKQIDSDTIEAIRNMVESGPEIQNILRDNSHFGAGDIGGGDSNYNIMPDSW